MDDLIDRAAEWLIGDDTAYAAEPDFARRAARYMLAVALAPRPIETAPRDGTHIIGIVYDGGAGLGWFDGKTVPMQTVIHWWSNDNEEGFYTSVNETEPRCPFPATHWVPLFAPSSLAEPDAKSSSEAA